MPVSDYLDGLSLTVLRERQATAARQQIDQLSSFFDLSLAVPDIRSTWRNPYYDTDFDPSRLTEPAPGREDYIALNPVLPYGGGHEARHAAQRQVIRRLSRSYPEELQNYYEEDLYGLQPTWGLYGLYNRSIRRPPPADEVYDEVIREQGLTELLPTVISWKNYETDIQEEVFAHNSRLYPRILEEGVAGAYFGYAGGESALFLQQQLKAAPSMFETGLVESAANIPQSILFLFSTLMVAGFLRDAVSVARPQPLTERELEPFSFPDRRRAMVYNSRIEPDIESFLDRLDQYDIR